MYRISRRFFVWIIVCALLMSFGLGWVQWMHYKNQLQSRKQIVMSAVLELWNNELESTTIKFESFVSNLIKNPGFLEAVQSQDSVAVELFVSSFLNASFPEPLKHTRLYILDENAHVMSQKIVESPVGIHESELWRRSNDLPRTLSGIEWNNMDGHVFRFSHPWLTDDGYHWVWLEIPLGYLVNEIDFDPRVRSLLRNRHSESIVSPFLNANGSMKTIVHGFDQDKLKTIFDVHHHGVLENLSGRVFSVGEFGLLGVAGELVGTMTVLDDIKDARLHYKLSLIRSIGLVLVGTLLFLIVVPKAFSNYEQKIWDTEKNLDHQMEEGEKVLVKLEERERLFRNLFEGSPIPMIQIDYDIETEQQIIGLFNDLMSEASDSEIVHFAENPDLSHQLAQAEMDCINTAALDFFALSGKVHDVANINWLVDLTDDIFKTALVRLIAKNRSFTSFECEITPSYGAKRIALVDFAAVQSWEDQESIIITFQDITENKREHEAALSAKAEAEEANRLKSSFLSNMSHELKTPLNAIIGFSDLLSDTTKDPVSLEQLKLIQDSGRHLLNIVKDILELTHLDSDQSRANFYPFGLQEFLSDLIHPFILPSSEKGIELVHGTEKMPSAFVYCDQVKLHHIFTNLLDNAQKFTREGTIEVGASIDVLGPGAVYRAGDLSSQLREEIERVVSQEFDNPEEAALCRLHFSVADTGPGVKEDTLHRIFDSFYQGDSSATRRHGGAGLGLTVCRKLVKMMDGNIAFRNRKEGGVLVEFTLYGVTSITDS